MSNDDPRLVTELDPWRPVLVLPAVTAQADAGLDEEAA